MLFTHRISFKYVSMALKVVHLIMSFVTSLPQQTSHKLAIDSYKFQSLPMLFLSSPLLTWDTFMCLSKQNSLAPAEY